MDRWLKLVDDLSPNKLESKIKDTYTPNEIADIRKLTERAEPVDTRLKHPFTMLVAGPSQSGKSCLVREMIAHEFIDPKPEKVVWCYSQWQPMYDEMKNLVDQFVEGLDYHQHVDGITPTLLVIDDLQDEASADTTVANLFKRGSHHKNISVIYIVQNLFFQGKKCRDISTNAHYVVMFNNPADRMQVNRFAQRIGNFDFVMQTYRDVCSKPHGYLMFDFTQGAPDRMRYRTGIPTKKLFRCNNPI